MPFPSREEIRTRLRAGAVHLSISVAIAALLVAVVFGIWYPAPLDRATGVLKIFLMVLGVDVAIGPMITVLIFDRRKKSLRFDLAVVAALQLGALVYGVHTVLEGRPVYVVFNVDRFDVVAADEIDPKSQQRATLPEFHSVPFTGPLWIAAVMPDDIAERNKILMSAVSGGHDLPQLPEYYVPLASLDDQIKARLQPIDALLQFNPSEPERTRKLLEPYLAHPDLYGFLPLRARVEDLTVVLSRKSGAILKTLPLKPWKD